MDKFFGRRRTDDGDEKPSGDVTYSPDDGDSYGGGGCSEDYSQKASYDTGDGDGYSQKTTDNTGAGEDTNIRHGGGYSQKTSHNAGGEEDYAGEGEDYTKNSTNAAGVYDTGDYTKEGADDESYEKSGSYGGEKDYSGNLEKSGADDDFEKTTKRTGDGGYGGGN
ncbi:hypothetical protein KSP40_PGU018553 [Platanthera guangdongensis]|uniref:Dehydrin n=1 Tax=Platanthera guangdongensis TaxID=2320717 RepID=A0ABR2LS40_9ASPA